MKTRHDPVPRVARYFFAASENTPAALHGRPELVTALTDELRAAIHAGGFIGC